MFTSEEKRALDKIKQIDNVESRLNDLSDKIKGNLRYPQEIFDEYVQQVKQKLEQQEKK